MAAAALILSSAVFAKTVIIDVRTPQEFARGNIAQSINIDHSVIHRDILKANVAKDDHVILYCRSGRRSGIAMDVLKKMGYTKVENYGGMEEAKKRLGTP